MTVLTPRPKCKAVLLTPVLYFRLPETDDSLALGLEAFEDKYGHGIVRRMPSVTRTLIDRSRNIAIHEAQKVYDADYYIFADGDQFYPTGDLAYWRTVTKSTLPERYGKVNFFERLLSHGPEYKIIGGLYKDRRNGVEYQTNSGHNEAGWNAKVDEGKIRGVQPQKWIATGATRYAASLFTELREKAKTDRTLQAEIMPMVHDKEWGYFSRSRHHQVGEDVSLSLRAKESCGIQSWVDCELRCWHCGNVWY
jgi:hypothetical protein